jgi:hypothetical protein
MPTPFTYPTPMASHAMIIAFISLYEAAVSAQRSLRKCKRTTHLVYAKRVESKRV